MSATISKTQILTWINESLDLNITKLETLGPGCVYIQLLDYINETLIKSDNRIPLQLVYWTDDILQTEKDDYELNMFKKRNLRMIKNYKIAGKEEMTSNYKLFQKWLLQMSINKKVLMDRLMQCKFQTNLEFCQWFYKYINTLATDKGFADIFDFIFYTKQNNLYNATERRYSISSSGNTTSSSTRTSIHESIGSRRSSLIPKRNISSRTNNKPSRTVSLGTVEDESLRTIKRKYENIIQTINTERQLYFDKLRCLELLVLSIQENNNLNENPELSQMLNHVLKILYDNDNFSPQHSEDLNNIIDEEVKKTDLNDLNNKEIRMLSIDDNELF
ncbi:uncharacterized protein HGUI_03849 [Hanseniaspora guilliermondii]|uniref:EB1 C-terminal domain-containing protein n=1 Tax=Hanseniaspora guilliermondii TaxID=56406 RepID=A0A1L0B517_9ASCO|nr:uncharacterized protein HGUI_03849 [Hanseniaspora guilliermondii]